MTTETKAAFARRLGAKPSYVRELEKSGRLVLEGKLVNVEATLALMESSRDPGRAANALTTGMATMDEPAAPDSDAAAAHPEDAPPDAESGPAQLSYQAARAARENWNARHAEMDYRRAAGELVELAAVTHTVASAATLLRERLESMGAMLSQQLAAESDAGKCQRLIDDYVETKLADVSAEFKRLEVV